MTAEECVKLLVGQDRIYAWGERTPGRKRLKPGDLMCFYATGKDTIPDLSPPPQQYPFGIDISAIQLDVLNRPNDNFFRELAVFEFARRLLRPIRVVVRNVGEVAADNVRVELTVPKNTDALVVYAYDMPDAPKERIDFGSSHFMKGMRPAFRRDPGEVRIDKNDDRMRVEIDCGDLQPGRRVWSDVFYIGKLTTGTVSLCGSLFAGNLSQPKDFKLAACITVRKTEMTVEQLRSLPPPLGQDE